MGEGHEQPPEVFPSRESLSYSEENIGLTRMPIDWELTNEEALSSMSPAEKLAAEQDRRIYYAILDISKTLDRVVPPDEGMTAYDRANRTLNPDQYPITPEEPEVGPPDR
jgi:hypothetical protein